MSRNQKHGLGSGVAAALIIGALVAWSHAGSAEPSVPTKPQVEKPEAPAASVEQQHVTPCYFVNGKQLCQDM